MSGGLATEYRHLDRPGGRAFSPSVYFVAGEVSGDNHAAALMRALRQLRPELHFIGRGGPEMKALAGEGFRDWMRHAAVLGLWEVVRKYGYFRKQFRETLEEIEKEKPDAIILIDYPGFNLRLARALRRRAPSLKILYYISPQVWAWNRGRIKQMARSLDLMLCIFPFEAELYNRSGLRTIFVGHPMLERLQAEKTDTPRDPNLIALFPGSRWREVRKILPVMLRTAAELVRTKPDLRFEVAASSTPLAQGMEKILNQISPLPPNHSAGGGFSSTPERGSKSQLERTGAAQESRTEAAAESAQIHRRANDRPQIKIKIGNAAEIMQRAFAGIIASGSATQEAAYFRLPFVLVYKVSWLTYLPARLLIKLDYLGMPNILANKPIVPEFVQHEAKPRAIAEAVLRLIHDPEARSTMIAEFDEIIASLGERGASDRAAHAILGELGS
jgi:lipid-A-disaccharide synthase